MVPLWKRRLHGFSGGACGGKRPDKTKAGMGSSSVGKGNTAWANEDPRCGL